MNDKELQLLANEARQEVIKMLVTAASGHVAGPLGTAELFTVLYFDHAKIDPHKPADPDRDYILVSNGHICPIWYTVLAMKGYFPKEELSTFRKINSRLQGHPHNGNLPGIENSGGPLGQGVSKAVGIALALKMDKKPNHVYCFTSDGEHEEGQTWEAIMFAAYHKLDNLTFILDRNHIQIDGNTEDILDLDGFQSKYKSFGWNVVTIDGNNVKAIKTALNTACSMRGKPTVIIAETIPGKGVSFMERKYEWHSKLVTEELGKKALAELQKEREKIGKRWWQS